MIGNHRIPNIKEKIAKIIPIPQNDVIKPILFKFLGSTAVKELVVKLLEAYAKTTDNTVDDKLTALVKKNLLGE